MNAPRPSSLWRLLVALALAASGALTPSVAGKPKKPANCRAVPDYADNSIIVEWDDEASDEDGYRVLRAPSESGPFVQIGPDLPADSVMLTDVGLDDGFEYFYRIRAYNADGASDPSNTFQQNLKVLWPNPGHLALLHNWNETLGVAGSGGLGYHKGVDVQQTGSSQNEIVFPRGGIVARTGNQGWDNNHIYLEVKIGDEYRYDSFNHLDGPNLNDLDHDVGDYVRAGQVVGKIADEYFTWETVDWVDHVHFFVPSDAFTNEVDGQHPLKIFRSDAEQDPQEVLPEIHDHAGDGTVLFHRQGAPAGPPYLSLPLGDDPGTAEDEANVDIHVEIADRLNDGAGTTHVPMSVAYWIEGRACDGAPAAVKNADGPYMLLRWDHRFFLDHGVAWQLLVDEAQDLTPLIQHDGIDYPFNWNNFKHFIITNTAGTDGEAAGVDSAQYWNTNAADDGSPSGAAHANFAAMPDATRAQEARFPDGDYTLHAIVTDLLGTAEQQVDGVRLENFPPAVRRACSTAGASQAGGDFVLLEFSEPMDRAAVDSAITIDPQGGGEFGFTSSWRPGDCAVELIPETLPDADEPFLLTVSADIAADVQGRLLDGAFDTAAHDGASDGAPVDSYVASFAFAPLWAIEGVRVDVLGGGSARLTWDVSTVAESYSVSRGDLSALGPDQYGSCLATGLGSPSYDDPDVPLAGEGFFYLVQGVESVCGNVGSLGRTSAGDDRQNLDPGACHGSPSAS